MIVAGLRLLFRAFHLVGDLFVFVWLRQMPDNGRTEWVKLRGSLYRVVIILGDLHLPSIPRSKSILSLLVRYIISTCIYLLYMNF